MDHRLGRLRDIGVHHHGLRGLFLSFGGPGFGFGNGVGFGFGHREVGLDHFRRFGNLDLGHIGGRRLITDDRDLAGQFGHADGLAVAAPAAAVAADRWGADGSVAGKQLSHRDGSGAVL